MSMLVTHAHSAHSPRTPTPRPISGELRTTLREQIERIPLFAELPLAMRDAIAEEHVLHRVEAGETLLRAGQSNDRMFVVISGELRVYLRDESAPPIATVRAGDTVGELSVIDRRPVSATVIAHTTAMVLEIDEPAFWRISRASHAFALRLMLALAERLRANNGAVQASLDTCAKLEEIAARDALTGVQSRRWLDAALPEMCAKHHASSEALSVLVVDVDHFKRVNDTYGHKAGDVVLSTVAQTLRAKLRPSDHVARFGGEEFVVILPGTGLTGARVAAERLRIAIREAVMPVREGAVLPSVTVSLGVAELKTLDDVTKLIERADAALYRAKHAGRNRVEA